MQIMFLCTLSKAHHLILERINYTSASPATWLHLPANNHFCAEQVVYVSFRSKTQLIEHYEKTLGAVHFGGHLMIIDSNAALKLIEKYFDK